MARASKSLKVRKGDTVEVIAGKDRGKRGVVQRVDAAAQRVVVEGVNVIKRHTKARPPQDAQQARQQQQQPQGGVVEKPAAVHVSNVALVSPASGKPTRVGYRLADDGRKVRISRRDDVDLDETKGK
jgi:large subunit ribosomal protein L24